MELSKEQLWKAMHQPSEKNCENCTHGEMWQRNNSCHECGYMFLPPVFGYKKDTDETYVDNWVWNEVK